MEHLVSFLKNNAGQFFMTASISSTTLSILKIKLLAYVPHSTDMTLSVNNVGSSREMLELTMCI